MDDGAHSSRRSEFAARHIPMAVPARARAHDQCSGNRFAPSLALHFNLYAVGVGLPGRESVTEQHGRNLGCQECHAATTTTDATNIYIVLTARALNPHLKIIAMSGAFGGEFLKAAELMGARAALSKPIVPEKLWTGRTRQAALPGPGQSLA